MQITITEIARDLILNLDVPADMELENFLALVSHDTQIPIERIVLLFNGQKMEDKKKTLADFGVKEHDMILIQQRPAAATDNVPASATSSATTSSGAAGALASTPVGEEDLKLAKAVYDKLKSSPEHLAVLRQSNQYLREAFDKGLEEFARVLKQQKEKQLELNKRVKMMTSPNADFDAEAQKMIEDEINRQLIETNLEYAMEHLPESFAQVTMLYIDLKVDGHPVKAFVDSGAQSTMISKACAQRCNIMRLVDTRFAGVAHGVGTQKILGKIHLTQVEIERTFLPASFMVLENQPMDILLGLDLLKSHQCCIDLQKNVLRIGTTGTETRFLSEGEIPKSATLVSAHELLNQANASAASGSGRVSPTAASVNENDVRELISKGYSRENVIRELNTANGDKTKALAALISKSFTFI